MASTPTTELERLAVRFAPSGGRCPRDGCGEDAPFVEVSGKRTLLPCSEHAMQDLREEVEQERQARAALFLAQAGCTRRMRGWSLETYRRVCGDEAGLAALAVAERWLKTLYDGGDCRNLILHGPVGAGKTGLAWSMVRDVCEHGIEARWVNFRTLLEQMKDAYKERVAVSKWMRGYFTCPVLCLDDLGSEKPTEWTRDQLLGMVDSRYERGLPTIYVSNYQLGVLGRRLGRDDEAIGKRIVSRMREGSTVHELDHDDRRLAA